MGGEKARPHNCVESFWSKPAMMTSIFGRTTTTRNVSERRSLWKLFPLPFFPPPLLLLLLVPGGGVNGVEVRPYLRLFLLLLLSYTFRISVGWVEKSKVLSSKKNHTHMPTRPRAHTPTHTHAHHTHTHAHPHTRTETRPRPHHTGTHPPTPTHPQTPTFTARFFFFEFFFQF